LSKKNKKIVQDACLKLKVEVKDLFLRAAEWANKTFGRRIKRGEALAAFRKWLATKVAPDWVDKYIAKQVFA
jgi:hypothetical protein